MNSFSALMLSGHVYDLLIPLFLPPTYHSHMLFSLLLSCCLWSTCVSHTIQSRFRPKNQRSKLGITGYNSKIQKLNGRSKSDKYPLCKLYRHIWRYFASVYWQLWPITIGLKYWGLQQVSILNLYNYSIGEVWPYL